MFHTMLSSKTTQMVPLPRTNWLPELKIEKNFKQHLLNHWSKFKIVSHNVPHNPLYQSTTNGSTQANKMAPELNIEISLNNIFSLTKSENNSSLN